MEVCLTCLLPQAVKEISLSSHQNLGRDVSVDVSKPEIAAAVEISQLCVFHSQEMQNGRMQIMDVHSIFHRVIAKLVSGAIGDASLDPAAGHPHRVAIR